MISVSNLNHHFWGTHALNNISFNVKEGSIVALIGPNGSGKTTLMRCISTLLPLQEGIVLINGINITDEPRKSHQLMGYLADNFGLYDDLTVNQCLLYTAYSRLEQINDIDALIYSCATETDVIGFLDKKVNTLSRGMRQRVGIAQAIIHNPKVLLLDEPASGLDPEARIGLSRLLIDLKNKGMTMIVSSHILSELEDYSSEMLIIKEGRLVEHTVLQNSNFASDNSLVLFKAIVENLTDEIIYLLKIMYPAVSNINLEKDELFFNLNETEVKQHEVLTFLIQQGVVVKEFSQVKRNLQDEYLKTIKNS